MKLRSIVVRWGGALVVLLAALTVALAQPAAAQSAVQPVPQMEDFWHIFIAYAIAWILLFGWLLSILKRIRRVEERLKP